MVYLPQSEMGRIEQLYRMVETYGYNASRDALTSSYQNWIKRKRKDGSGYYRGVNMTWIDWAMETLAGNNPDVITKDLSEMTDDEVKTMLRRQAEALDAH